MLLHKETFHSFSSDIRVFLYKSLHNKLSSGELLTFFKKLPNHIRLFNDLLTHVRKDASAFAKLYTFLNDVTPKDLTKDVVGKKYALVHQTLLVIRNRHEDILKFLKIIEQNSSLITESSLTFHELDSKRVKDFPNKSFIRQQLKKIKTHLEAIEDRSAFVAEGYHFFSKILDKSLHDCMDKPLKRKTKKYLEAIETWLDDAEQLH